MPLRAEAIIQAARHGGRTVLVSGTAVAIGFTAMLLVQVSEVRSIGVGGLVVTTVAVLVASTLLPILLAWIGPWIDAGSLGLARARGLHRHWRRWAYWVEYVIPWLYWPSREYRSCFWPLKRRICASICRVAGGSPKPPNRCGCCAEIDAAAADSIGEIVRGDSLPPPGTTIQDGSGWRAELRLARLLPPRDQRI